MLSNSATSIHEQTSSGSAGRQTYHNTSAIRSSDPGDFRTVVWGTTINIVESMTLFKNFIYYFRLGDESGTESGDLNFQSHYCKILKNLSETQDYNLNIDVEHLKSYEQSRKLYFQLLKYPQEIIPLMDHTINEIMVELFGVLPMGISFKVRPFNITERCVNLRLLEPSDIDQLITIKGIVIRSMPITPDLKQAFFQCSICDQTTIVDNDRGRIIEPIICPREMCRAKNSMRLIHNRCTFSDKQICRIQETPDETPNGQTPHTISVYIYDDLVEMLKAGDRVEITGIYRATPVRINPNKRTLRTVFKTFIDVVHAKTTNAKRICQSQSSQLEGTRSAKFNQKSFQDIFDEKTVEKIKEISQRPDLADLLTRSIAPSIYGLEDVKRGILLQLFRGANKFQRKGKSSMPKIRGDINILLVGDPGVSKSQLLQYVNKISPRGIYTSGRGSSAVGLTAYITRDPETRQTVLESGALVLSDDGICCIDEFDKMTEYTRSVLHEVMEQQTISLAKAGIITTLNARTSILASANPVNSKFSEKLSVVENVNLPPPLLSRFDLIYLILDKPNPEVDRLLAQHILSFYSDSTPADHMKEDVIPTELFAQYISYSCANVNPVISEEAGVELIDCYVNMRTLGGKGNSKTITFTTRQLESTIRLAEAYARMKLSPIVTKENVQEANNLIMSALKTSAVDPVTGLIDMDLVNTGIGSRYREEHAIQLNELREFFASIRQSSIKCIDAYETFVKKSSLHMEYSKFCKLLSELVESGVVHKAGNLSRDSIIYK